MDKLFLKKIINHDKLLLLILLVVYTAYYTFSIGQDGNFDLLNYHFFTGYSYLTNRIGDIAPANIQTFTHPAVNVLTYFAFDKLIFPYSAWLILSVQLLSIPALMLIADEISLSLTGNKISLEKNISLLICIISPLWLSELGTSFFSSTTTPLVLWSLYLIIRKNQNGVLEGIVAGTLMGIALGLKLTNAPFVIGSAFAVILKSVFENKEKYRFLTAYIIGGIIGVLITSGWYWELWVTWGNPLFPFYNKIFRSPYFEITNWRDNRWMFHNIKDYINFIADACVITNKTSEVPFKDSRIILISIAPLILLMKAKRLFDDKTILFITFFYVSYLLWALLFAYQRYAIPLEIMYGLIIWVTLHYVTKNKIIKNLTLIFITVISLSNFHIPNWGHLTANKVAKDPFGLDFSNNFDNRPARYLVDGVTISYLLKYLNPQSQFFGIRFSPQVDELIKVKIKKESSLPLRILTTESSMKDLPSVLSRFELNDKKLSCNPLYSNAGRYVICSVNEISDSNEIGNNTLNIQYSKKPGSGDISSLVYAQGLSDYEENGRWSNGSQIEWTFANCINHKKILLSVTGSAYGPNVGKEFLLHIANKTFSFMMKATPTTVKFNFDNINNECIRSLRIDVPMPTSPSQLGESQDSRKLGILVQNLSLSKN